MNDEVIKAEYAALTALEIESKLGNVIEVDGNNIKLIFYNTDTGIRAYFRFREDGVIECFVADRPDRSLIWHL